MNAPILPQSDQKTISSREIALLSDKQHGHVCRDIELLNQTYLEMGLSKIGEGYYTHPNTGNQQHREFLLTKEQCIDLITGYRADLRIKINRRWAELESHTQSTVSQFRVPATLSEALQLAADQAKKIEQDKPKVDYYEKIVVRDTLLNATQVAQKIGLSAVAMNKQLAALNVYNSGVKRARVFQQWFVDKGLGELKQTDLGFSQPMFTTKGEAWVIEKFVSEGIVDGGVA